jgi:hypothetical protein
MIAWSRPSDFDAMPKNDVRRFGRIAVVSDVFPMSSHYGTVVVARLA